MQGAIDIVGDIVAAVEQFQPVERFGTFFFRDCEFGGEILATAAVDRFGDIGSKL